MDEEDHKSLLHVVTANTVLSSSAHESLPISDRQTDITWQIRDFLQISLDTTAVIERYSDSAASFVTIERDNVQVYKQLFRAAKAKHKLKLRVSTPQAAPAPGPVVPQPATVEDEIPLAAESSLVSYLLTST